jgi:hypothetical protein
VKTKEYQKMLQRKGEQVEKWNWQAHEKKNQKEESKSPNKR